MRRTAPPAGAPRRSGLSAAVAAVGVLALCVAPAAGASASASATQTRSAPSTPAATPSPSGTYVPGVIRTFAGTGAAGLGGDGGAAIGASLHAPVGLAVDDSGNVLIADTSNHRIRRVAAGTGIITTVAGNGVSGFSGDGGPGTSASLRNPHGLALDGSGNVLIADTVNNRIRRVAAGTGIITTVAGTGVGSFSGDGGAGTSASLRYPWGVTVDDIGNVLFADSDNHRIRRVDAGTGVITTVTGTGAARFSGDGGPATSADLWFPRQIVLDDSGNVLFADDGNRRIRRVAAETGVITTVAGTGATGFSGDGGPATSASLAWTYGVAVDGGGNVLIADSSNRVRIVSAATQPSPRPTPSPSTTPYCFPALFRPLPRTDLVGSLVGTALAPGEPLLAPTEAACRQACCDAASCDGYSFEASVSRRVGAADCYLLVNVSQLVPSNTMASGLRESVLL